MTSRPPSDRATIESGQLGALQALLSQLLDRNPFYAPRLRDAGLEGTVCSLEQFTSRMPFTTKDQVMEDQRSHPPYGSNLTEPLGRYTRFNQTSGTAGAPMRWLDTDESWQWMLGNWKQVLEAAGTRAGDRALFAFSFGPFLGFWTAFEAAVQCGLLCIPTGNMSSAARLAALVDNEVHHVFCTPTYALRLAEVAQQEGIDLGKTHVKTLIVAGEPGGTERWNDVQCWQ